jgi:hypothetical protein
MCPERRYYDEKCEFLRVPVSRAVGLERLSDGNCFAATGRNLSASGVLFDTAELLCAGDRLQMQIGSGQPLVADLGATIEAVRVEPLSGSGRCAVGSAIRAIHNGSS